MGRTGRDLRRFLRRPPVSRRLLVEAGLRLAVARVALAVLPFRRLARRFGTIHAESLPALAEGDRVAVARVGRAVNAVAKRAPWRSDCFPRAIAARAMLARRGVASTLYLGVQPEDERGLAAHAWLRCGDVIVTGAPEHRRYTVVATFASLPKRSAPRP